MIVQVAKQLGYHCITVFSRYYGLQTASLWPYERSCLSDSQCQFGKQCTRAQTKHGLMGWGCLIAICYVDILGTVVHSIFYLCYSIELFERTDHVFKPSVLNFIYIYSFHLFL